MLILTNGAEAALNSTEDTMMNRLLASLTVILSAAVASTAFAAPTLYNSRATFQSQLVASVTDDYSNAGYAFVNTNAAMSAVLGETEYTSTGFANHNIVSSQAYCAGCNGSFLLDFTATSVGSASGVFGVGIDVLGNDPSLSYHALVTYGDNTTEDLLVSGMGTFWGLTSALDIKSIHFGLAGGGTTQNGAFQIDNLTIGSDGSGRVPEPLTLGLVGLGLAGLGLTRRRVPA